MAARIYSINEDFFKSWTLESGWLFGWSYGDGCFTNPLCLKFDLGIKDREVLDKFKMVLKSEHPIFDYELYDKRYQKSHFASRIQFYSKELVTDINKLSFYDIPEEYFSDTIRGFFEAEGSVFWHKSKKLRRGGSIASSITNNDKELLMFIHQYLQDIDIIEGGYMNINKNSWRLKLSANDTISMYHYMYDNCANKFLQRKKMKFEELIKRQKA